MIVAIDGPAGAGKSTVAKLVAKQLGYVYIDSGAMYRSVALKYLREGGPTSPPNPELAAQVVKNISIHLTREGRVLVDGVDETETIRTPEITQLSSPLSALPSVRAKLTSLQQEMGKNENVVMEGRDIGTVVFPNAQVKIFLTASVEERVKRRFLELKEKGYNPDFEALRKEVVERDERDSTRDIAPLKKAPDAVVVDTDRKSIEKVVAEIVAIVHRLSNVKTAP